MFSHLSARHETNDDETHHEEEHQQRHIELEEVPGIKLFKRQYFLYHLSALFQTYSITGHQAVQFCSGLRKEGAKVNRILYTPRRHHSTLCG